MHGIASPTPTSRRLVAALAAVLALCGGLGLHLGPHGPYGETERIGPTTESVGPCNGLRTLHVESYRTVHVPECPACLLGHSKLSVVRPPSPALLAALPEVPSAPAPHGVPLPSLRAPTSRGPPLLSV
jgi:hypothetical protein